MGNHLPTYLLYYGGVWNDITADVSQNDAVRITTGQPELSQTLRPSKIELTLEDPTGKYRPYLATSPLYGLAGRNTPLTVADDVVTEDFEDASFTVTIGQGASVNGWARSTTTPHTGGWCFKSGTTADGAFSDAIIDAPAAANICILYYRTDCSSTDVLQISTGGTVRLTASGTGGTWQQVMVPIIPASGLRQVTCRYLKDASGTAGADAVYIDDVRFMHSRAFTEVTGWEPDRTVGFNAATGKGRQWTSITAGGLLARISTWTDPLQSAMTRTVLGFTTLLGFWPCEEKREATQLSNLVTNGTPGTAVNVSFGDAESPGGGDVSIKMTATTSMSGAFTVGSTTGWQISRAMKLPAIPASATSLPMFWWRTSDGSTWTISVNNASYTLDVMSSAGVSLLSSAILFGTGAEPDKWITMRVKASYSGGTVSYEIGWYPEGASVLYVPTGSFAASSLGRLLDWHIDGNANLDGAWVGYIYGVDGVTDDLLNEVRSSFNGYVGELATERFRRLMIEQGFSRQWTYIGNGALSEPMGPQRPDTFVNLLTEVRDTDGGIMADSDNRVGITYRTRVSLYNQTAALALTYGTNVAAPITPVLDNLDSYNVVTVTQRDGGSVTVEDDTSAMGTLPPPAGIGTLKQTIDVNVSAESRMQQIGFWWLGIGTVPDARYPTVTVDLDANPELEATAGLVRPGDRITVASLDPDVIDLLVLGAVDRQPEQKRRTITFTCVPYRQFNVGVYDTARYDSASTTVNSSLNTTGTIFSIKTVDPDETWSTVDCPYPWVIGGELMTVTAMSAVTHNSPISHTQTATVTRSVNGVVKTHDVGEPIHIATPGRYAL